ncbi:hypothetical protein BJ085DRAFT_37381 [Dimargaris cristalligena]|uniref:Uncharacterized protein n=1 Tax=Dimargaris cristalligena TaxID=215637 RepID=A0A4P9ZW98_9FUNG|nr:hypothetical protein BJ085DRAFT_37381 [Dimargaris cristalligena]|eukprot:RKP37231.1 hypothetical protein BJ085DRAFT_37381 [Dimargaris cristalligena]
MLAPTLLGSPVPEQDYHPYLPIGRPQSGPTPTIENVRLTRAAAAELERRLDEAGIAVPLIGDNGSTPIPQLTPQHTAIALQFLQEMLRHQDASLLSVQPEGQLDGILAEIRGADEITEALAPDDNQDIRVFFATVPQSKTKKLIYDYVLGNQISFDLEEGDGNSVETISLQHSVPPPAFSLGSFRSDWCHPEAGNAKEEMCRTILAEQATTFNSGHFFNEFPQAGQLLETQTGVDQEAILNVMENQLMFTL